MMAHRIPLHLFLQILKCTVSNVIRQDIEDQERIAFSVSFRECRRPLFVARCTCHRQFSVDIV